MGGQPADVAVGAGAVWVADSARASVVRVDGGRRQVTGTITGIGPNPACARHRRARRVGRDGRRRRVWRVDSDANAVAGSVRVGGQPRDITTDGEHLWVTDRERDRVIEIDASSARVVKREKVDGGPLEVAVDDRAVSGLRLRQRRGHAPPALTGPCRWFSAARRACRAPASISGERRFRGSARSVSRR